MQVTLIDHMGSDLTVVNAARVSFNKESQREKNGNTNDLRMEDKHLIKYLAKHGHWSPFSHCFLQFRIEAPLFVARQLVKHQVGLAWNEVSRRYVDYTPKFYTPQSWRKKADNVKQGSSDDTIDYHIGSYTRSAIAEYERMLDVGIAPEMARMVLPQNMYTEWYWSGSLYAFSRVVNQRLDKTAQAETRYIADLISQAAARFDFKYSWKALTGEELRINETEKYID
ncbi:MAG TPA: FAD-dependent thymidylate synthase [Dehalococcoidia bacterium]|jgi:thymidylate synthase (FAD)|nr:FAD-dependent thymidylate synthase [Dehalococcoidia bacterium]